MPHSGGYGALLPMSYEALATTMMFMIRICAAALLVAARMSAQTAIAPLASVRAGMTGTGKTVFSGTKIEEFQVEILGVLENAGPKQSIILARLSGGPLAHSGVMQGMSGSPVYIQGKLVGAVASAFQFSKEPIAGIRPIEEMLRRETAPSRASWDPDGAKLAANLAPRTEYPFGSARLTDLATPLFLSGFSAGTLDQFAPRLRQLGLDPAQGSLGGAGPMRDGDPKSIQPGSMISVQLISGDLAMGADGTVTHVDGDKVYAFGHRFLAVGPVEIPFARSEVLTLLPNLSTSFKISTGRDWVGSITSDYTAAVAGRLGHRASTVPVTITMNGDQRAKYDLRLVRDRLLTPLLLQMATFSAIDATERMQGASTVSVKGKLEFTRAAPVAIDTIYSSDTNVALLASLAASLPAGYAMQSGFPDFDLRLVTLDLTASNEKRQYQVESVWPAKARIRPGESVDIFAQFTGPGGREITRKTTWRAPSGFTPGQVNLTVSDAMTANLVEYQQVLLQAPDTARQVHGLLNGLKPNSTATLRIWRPEPVFQVRGHVVPDPPPSVALVLKRSPAFSTGVASAWGSKVAEAEFRIDGVSISGSRSAALEVKE
jgi:hypothetical protein